MIRSRACRLVWALGLACLSGVGPAAAEDAAPPSPVLSLGGSRSVVDLLVSRDGRLLLACDAGGELRLWDLSASMLVSRLGRESAYYRSAALSPDGRWVAAIETAADSVNGTDTVQLIDVSTGVTRQVYPSPGWRPGEGEAPAPSALGFSPDGRLLAFATSAALLDPPPPKPSTPEGFLGCALHVLTLDGSSPVVSRYVRSRPVETLPMGTVEALAYLPDGSRLVLVFEDGVARLFDPAKGAYGKEVSLGKDATLGFTASSADGRWWALAPPSDEAAATPVTLWDATTAKRAGVRVPRGRTVLALALGGSSLFVATQDAEGSARIERAALPGGGALATVASASEGITSLASDPAGRVVLSGSERPEGGLRVREAGTGDTLEDLPAGGSAPTVAFGAGDGHLLMLRDGRLYEWNLSLSSAATGDARSASGGEVLSRWPAPQGEFVQAFAADERGRPVLLATRGLGGPLVLLREGAPPLELLAHASGLLLAPGLTSDAHFAFAATSKGQETHLSVWDIQAGPRAGQRVAHLGPVGAGSLFHVAALDLREGGTRAAVLVGIAPGGQAVEECWDLATSTRRWSVAGQALLGLALVSPSGRQMVTYSASFSEAHLTVADLAASAAPRTIKVEDAGADMQLDAFAFVQDEAAVRLHLANGHRLDVNLTSGTTAPAPAGPLPVPAPRPRAAFHTPLDPVVSPSGRLRAVPAWGGRIDVYATGQMTPLASLVVPEDPIAPDGWSIFTADGYYAANTSASRLIGLRRGTTVLPFEQFDSERNRPDLVFERLGTAPPEALARLREARLTRGTTESAPPLPSALGPALLIDRATLVRATTAASTPVPLVLRGADPASLRMRVTVNGAPVPSPAPAWDQQERDGARHGTLSLELVEGPNAVLVSALDSQGRASVPERVVVVRTSRPASRRLLFLGVGVEAYADARYALEYAADDVEALAALFRTFAGPVQVARMLEGGTTRVEEVDRLEVEAATLTDAAATREGIVARLESMLLKAGVQDTVIVALSGHGALDTRRQCWFAPVNMDFAAPERFGLSYRDLDALLARCPARRKVLLMDACHTGASGDFLLRGALGSQDLPPNVTVRPGAKGLPLPSTPAPPGHILSADLLGDLFQDLSASSGTVILAAASGEQLAFETPEARHGLFTHALLAGLDSTLPDRTLDGRISVRELQEYVREQVRTLSRGRQVPTFRRAPREADFLLR